MANKIADIKIKVPEGIESLTPYPPGKPMEELERELGLSGTIKLASNENPLGPSKKAVEALKTELQKLNRYPDGSNFYLKKRLSAFLNMPEENLVIGNGSNEIIELLMRTFLNVGDEVVMAEPSFAVYPLIAQAAGCASVRVPLREDMTHDLDEMARRITPKTKLIFVCTPNNPTGTLVCKQELDSFMEKVPEGVIVCIDEAYYEYVEDKNAPDALDYLKQGKTVVVLRTFSKIYGLAGLRVGYGVAPAKIVDYINRVRQPFNVNSLAQTAALAALDDIEHVENSRKVNSEGLKYLYGELDKLGIGYVKTQANFFLIKTGRGTDVYNGLLKKGVIVRPMKSYGLDEYVRLTVGTREENERFLNALKEVLK